MFTVMMTRTVLGIKTRVGMGYGFVLVTFGIRQS